MVERRLHQAALVEGQTVRELTHVEFAEIDTNQVQRDTRNTSGGRIKILALEMDVSIEIQRLGGAANEGISRATAIELLHLQTGAEVMIRGGIDEPEEVRAEIPVVL